MVDDYDWRVDALESWRLAIAELRRRGLREGRYKPETDEERAYVLKCRAVPESK
jgi:hypothetical protein